jgi:hypothetical protein
VFLEVIGYENVIEFDDEIHQPGHLLHFHPELQLHIRLDFVVSDRLGPRSMPLPSRVQVLKRSPVGVEQGSEFRLVAGPDPQLLSSLFQRRDQRRLVSPLEIPLQNPGQFFTAALS